MQVEDPIVAAKIPAPAPMSMQVEDPVGAAGASVPTDAIGAAGASVPSDPIGAAGASVPTATTRRLRNMCPYCHRSLKLVGEEFVHKKGEVFKCMTCQTNLVYETEKSSEDHFFFETLADDVDDEDPAMQDRGDFDCDEGVIAQFEDLVGLPRALRKGDAINVETKDGKGGKVVRPGWLLDDPQVIIHSTSRSAGVFRYAVVFDVAQNKNLQAHYFPPMTVYPKGKPR